MHAGEANNCGHGHAEAIHAATGETIIGEYKMKYARRRGEQWRRPAGTRRQFLRRHRRNDQAGGDTNEMHAGEGQWRRPAGIRGKFSAATVETVGRRRYK
ncbi:MAG: hypothetical protein ACLTDS_05560 [Bianqueaceae bacterium]